LSNSIFYRNSILKSACRDARTPVTPHLRPTPEHAGACACLGKAMLSSIVIGGFSTSAGSEIGFGLCLYGHMVEGIGI
jgi:hypothetical protein